MTPREKILTDAFRVLKVVLRHTREHPAPASVITEITGVRDKDITEIISVAAAEGIPVISTPTGYCHWTKVDQLLEYQHREMKRAISNIRKVRSMRQNQLNPVTLFEQE